jgi:hypothetical protein
MADSPSIDSPLPKLKLKFSTKTSESDKNVTGFSERAERRAAKQVQLKKRKTPLSVALEKILITIIQKDTYGFFLRPVDPKLVPDYHVIIKNPMDLG